MLQFVLNDLQDFAFLRRSTLFKLGAAPEDVIQPLLFLNLAGVDLNV